jgi:hypothetical protein
MTVDVELKAESEFAPGTGCFQCRAKSHFCPAHDYDNQDRPACKSCLRYELCGPMKAREREFNLDGPELPPAQPTPGAHEHRRANFPDASVAMMCVYGCGKRRHRGICAARRAAAGVTRVPMQLKVTAAPLTNPPEVAAAAENGPGRILTVDEVRAKEEVFPEREAEGLGDFATRLERYEASGDVNAAREAEALEPLPTPAQDDEDDGVVVDVSSIPSARPQSLAAPLQQKIDRAINLPLGKAVGWKRPSKPQAKNLYDTFRKKIRTRHLPLQARIAGLTVWLWKVER